MPTYFAVPDRSLFIIPKGGLGRVANVCRGGGQNHSYATDTNFCVVVVHFIGVAFRVLFMPTPTQ